MTHYPIIVVEGADCTGKTTWSKAYCEKYSGHRAHLSYRAPARHMFAWQVASLVMAVRRSKEQPVVIDRHWPSENIYAAVYRGGTELYEQSEWMARVMSRLGVFYLVCTHTKLAGTIEAHKAACLERNEMYKPDKKFEQVVLGYWDWYHGSNLCGVDTGYCREFGSMSYKHMAAYGYRMDAEGRSEIELKMHLHCVNALATAWRSHCMNDPLAQKMASNKRLLLRELGYKIKKS